VVVVAPSDRYNDGCRAWRQKHAEGLPSWMTSVSFVCVFSSMNGNVKILRLPSLLLEAVEKTPDHLFSFFVAQS
jgi:hypothetical protein